MSQKSQFLVVWTVIIAVCLLFTAVPARAQTIVHSFDGDSGPGLATCESGSLPHCDHSEMNVAVNGKQVVQVTQQNVRVYDYSGHLLKSTPMSTLIRNAGLDPAQPRAKGPIEPEIVYDEFIGRWIITITCLNDCTLVSASSDALGSWGGIYLSCLQNGACLNFDPALRIGYDKNGVYTCGAHVGDDNPNTVKGIGYDCFAVPSSEVGAIAHGAPPAHINRVHNMPLDVMPAIDHNRHKSASAPAFFVNKSCERTPGSACEIASNYPFNWVVNTFTWTGHAGTYNVGGSEQMVKTDVGSAQNKWLSNLPCCDASKSNPPVRNDTMSIPQAGNNTVTLRIGESHRMFNLVQFGSHLQGVLSSGPCTSSCGSQGTDTNNVMFWVDLDCTKTTACVVSQTAKISGASFNPEFTTVGVDSKGNVGIVADSSTASTDLSVLLWTHRTTDAPNTFNGPTTIVSGTQPYTCINTHNLATVGNAVGVLTALDPLDGTKLWTTQQWSNDATPCVWNTRIVEYKIDR